MPPHAPMDACDLLDADHIAVKHLFVDYARLAMALAPAGGDHAPEPPGDDRAAIAMKICDELTVHAQIEEEIFYPALRSALPDADALLDEAKAEHQEVKDRVAAIRAKAGADEEMDMLVSDLANCVEHHVKEERDMLFPKARSAPGLDLMALAQQLKDRQGELQKA